MTPNEWDTAFRLIGAAIDLQHDLADEHDEPALAESTAENRALAAEGEALLPALASVRTSHAALLDAVKAMLDVQSKRRHPLGQPDEGIAYEAADAATKARAAIAQAEHRDSGKPEEPPGAAVPANVRNFLDLSTGHLTPESRGWIEQHLARGPTYDHPDGCYGWLVWVPADDDEHPTPPDVLACYAKAREFNCDYLLFDSDAEECPGLDYYPDAEDDEEESVTPAAS